jgi:hypothetical protein
MAYSRGSLTPIGIKHPLVFTHCEVEKYQINVKGTVLESSNIQI